ncbi:Metallo-beta-lactamase superfamily protein [Fervidobacterium changbaicum]|uniref:MBL fold metallo-hydrolase n=2 Tax=Fervidobacterium TaxID=2422 RepID=A0AAI8GCU1_FERIS|nr:MULTISPECIES: MBL fold metallo-hydrolase [Fervidobacterium]AMW32296.1 MBL fold metallo-hydrolase [Fervidobacterium islandicum]QAV32357.1 MBL fold metallo-hydrolase [Fervidobacterium changbaicum]SDH21501.1 Metallo-beta-lactamase superfamily protein [Fervidobacterium changbaicum]
MIAEIINYGGSIRVPKSVEVAYSTPVLLKYNERIILIDPGDYVSFGFLEEYFESHNISLEDVTDILLTHLHLDHAYATKLFTNATIYIHAAYKSKPYNKFGLIKSKLYLEIINSWKNVVEIDAGVKLFDGKIHVFHTPWHAKEHCSFTIDTENLGRILYTGDIVMNRVEFYDIIRWLRNDDCARFINTIGRKCDYIVFTHDEYVKSSDYFRG